MLIRDFLPIFESDTSDGLCHIDELPPELHEQAVKLFDELAKAQRDGEPERLGGASLYNRGIHVSGLYAGLTEHVGDITNRMAKRWDWYHGSAENVRDKVALGLRRLESMADVPSEYGADILRQVRANYEFQSGPERDAEHAGNRTESKRFTGSFADWTKWWKEAGARYAAAHAALTVYNEAQWHARDAAVCCGQLDWQGAHGHLTALQGHLGSREEWVRYAGTVTIIAGSIVAYQP